MQKRTIAKSSLAIAKSSLWGVIVIGVGVLAAGLIILGKLELRFDEAQIQKLINTELAKRTDDNGFITVKGRKIKVNEVAISVGDKEMGVAFNMEGKELTQKIRLSAAGTGVPEFRDGAFYIKASNIEIREFVIGEGKIGEKIKGFANKHIDGPRKREAVIEAAPKIAAWVKEYAEVGVMRTLEKMPVYTVKNDAPGIILKASLDSLKVENGHLVAVLSVRQLTRTMLFIAFVAIVSLGLLVAMARYPGWGAPSSS